MDRAYLENRPPRWPWFLLALMTLACFGGPLAIYLVLQGGESPSWPPDRLIEWVIFFATISLVTTLFFLCLGLAVVYRDDFKRLAGPKGDRPDPSSKSS